MYNDGIHRFNPGSYQGRNWLLEQLSGTPKTPTQTEQPPKKEEVKTPALQSGNDIWSGGDYSSPGSQSSNQGGYNSEPGAMVSPGGFSFGFDSGKGMQGAARGGILGGMPGLLGGLLGGVTAQRTAPVFNSVAPVDVDGRANPDVGYFGDPAYNGEGFTSIGGNFGTGIGGGYGGDNTGSNNDTSNGIGANQSADSTNGFYKGGKVTKDRLFGHNPPGKDDGAAFLDAGEHVTRGSASQY